MNARFSVRMPMLAGMLLLWLGGCATEKPPGKSAQSSAEGYPTADTLRLAAEETFRDCGGAPNAEGGIPPQYWADPIKALHPIKVYTHRVNVVVVQRVHDGIEEGKYIYILISSYLPHTGDDGFEFTPNPQKDNIYTLGDGVFDFKRTRNKP